MRKIHNRCYNPWVVGEVYSNAGVTFHAGILQRNSSLTWSSLKQRLNEEETRLLMTCCVEYACLMHDCYAMKGFAVVAVLVDMSNRGFS